MRVLGISGSPRGERSHSRRLLEQALAGAAESGAAIDLVDVAQLQIEPCTGCEACYRTGGCRKSDDFAGVLDRMLAADGLVLGCPNYFRSVTAQLKAVIDRMGDAIHRQLFDGKYGCSVASAGGPGWGEVTGYLNTTLLNFGAYVTGQVGVSLGAGPGVMDAASREAFDLGRGLAQAISERRVYPEQREVHVRTAGYFRRLVEMNRDRWPFEHDYWVKRGE